MTANNPVVESRRLTKIYRDFWGRQKKVALRALNLQIYRGEIFGLLGPNGSGKTTTIKLLLGLLFPSDGDALVFGQPASDVRKNERIGYLPEESEAYLMAERIADARVPVVVHPTMQRPSEMETFHSHLGNAAAL